MSKEAIQPVVLVGGRSRRFGRDKLREPWSGSAGGEWLVDQPRLVLRAEFGVEPWAVGACDPAVAARFARVVPDGDALDDGLHGPIRGIRAALRAAKGAVLVLAGDLPLIDRHAVLALREAAARAQGAVAVVARGDRLEPCIALYRPHFPAWLDARCAGISRTRESTARDPGAPGASSRLPPLHELLLGDEVVQAPIRAQAASNLNSLADLESLRSEPNSI